MIVLDTQVALWMTFARTNLSRAAAEAIRAAGLGTAEVALASSSLWEIAMVDSLGRVELPATLSDYLKHIEKLFVILPINGAIAERSIRFGSAYPNDPTDRIIGATALVYGAKLVTADKQIANPARWIVSGSGLLADGRGVLGVWRRL